MKQQEVFKKIGGILKELNDQYEYLKTTDFPLNDLELELFLANSNFLTDHVLIISKLNAQNAAAKDIPAIKGEEQASIKNEIPYEKTYFEPLVRVSAAEPQSKPEEKIFEIYKAPAKNEAEENPVPSIDLDTVSTGDDYSYIRDEEPETIRHELILDEADLEDEDGVEDIQHEVADEDIIELPPVPASPIARHEPEPTRNEQPEHIAAEPEIVFEEEPAKVELPEEKPYVIPEAASAQKDVLTINERISAQIASKQGVADQLHAQNITDLKQAINLNDKLLFVKDLFNGYSLAYSEAIEILNRFTTYAQAEQFLKNNYITKNHWDLKPEATEKFFALLRRRYA